MLPQKESKLTLQVSIDGAIQDVELECAFKALLDEMQVTGPWHVLYGVSLPWRWHLISSVLLDVGVNRGLQTGKENGWESWSDNQLL